MNDPIGAINDVSIDIKPSKVEVVKVSSEEEGFDFSNFKKIQKLEMLRQNILEQEKRAKELKEASKGKKKEDYYAKKLYRFLISSFIMNFILEPFFLYSMTYDYILSYFYQGQTKLEAHYNNWFYLAFYFFKVIGIMFGAKYIQKEVTEDVI